MLNGLASVNIELTSRCNKGDGMPGSGCWMCGRRKIEKEHPELAKWGDMDYEMVKEISLQLPHGIVVQFHDNGEPLLYPYLGVALALFKSNIRCLNTNGKLLVEKANEIIGNLDTITISVIPDDTEAVEQLKTLKEFIKIKGERKPNVIIRCLGMVDTTPYMGLGLICKRILHSPMGSFQYEKDTTVPEIGICQDFLHHLAIKRNGDVSFCVRFDPMRHGVIGDLHYQTLDQIWNGIDRQFYLTYHIRGERNKVPLCESCTYWGVPRG